jgi:hypothetical protein
MQPISARIMNSALLMEDQSLLFGSFEMESRWQHVIISQMGQWLDDTSSNLLNLHAAKSQAITMLGYALALIPFYLFVYVPVSQMLYGPSQKPPSTSVANSNASSIASDEPLSCPRHSYTTHILSQEPLIIYIENFLSTDESAHLLKIRYLNLPSRPAIPKITT